RRHARPLGDIAVLLLRGEPTHVGAVHGEERVPLHAVDPELGVGVVGAVCAACDRVDPAHHLVDPAYAGRRGVGRGPVAEDGRGYVVGGPAQAVERTVLVVAVLRDAGHRERV